MKKTIAIFAMALAAASLSACGSDSASAAAEPEPQSAVCEKFCGQLAELAEMKCTQAEVHTCATTLTDKVTLASDIDDAMASEPLSDYVEFVHNKVGAIGAEGEKFGEAKCFKEGANLGDRLYECRMSAKYIDERFDELVDLVRRTPA